MKSFELWRQKKGSFLYDMQEEHAAESVEPEYLDEGWIKDFGKKLLSSFKKTFDRMITSLGKLKPGQRKVMKFTMPKPILEAAGRPKGKDTQMGKKGGELAEAALLDKLGQLLPHDSVVWMNKSKPVSYSTWETQILKKAITEYERSESGNKVLQRSVWESHGYAGAEHIRQKLVKKLGDKYDVCTFKLEHMGIGMTGKEKTDFQITVEVPSAKDLLLKISMKATGEGTPNKTPPQGLQTGYSAMVMSLITGKYTGEFKDDPDIAVTNGLNAYSVALKNWEKDRTEEKFEKMTKAYEGSYLQALDDIGLKLGYTPKGGSYLGKYLEELSDWFEAYKKDHSIVESVEQRDFYIEDYINIIDDVVTQLSKGKKKQKLIQSVLRFGGLEKDLYYLSAGIDPRDKGKSNIKDKVRSAAMSTLFSTGYEKLLKDFIGVDALQVKIERSGGGKTTLEFVITNPNVGPNGISVIRFYLWKDTANARISLPYIGPKVEGETKSGSKLIAKLGDFIEPENEFYGSKRYANKADGEAARKREEEREEEDSKKKHLKTLQKRGGKGSLASVARKSVLGKTEQTTIQKVKDARDAYPTSGDIQDLEGEVRDIESDLLDVDKRVAILQKEVLNYSSEELLKVIEDEIPRLLNRSTDLKDMLGAKGTVRIDLKGFVDREKAEQKLIDAARKAEEKAKKAEEKAKEKAKKAEERNRASGTTRVKQTPRPKAKARVRATDAEKSERQLERLKQRAEKAAERKQQKEKEKKEKESNLAVNHPLWDTFEDLKQGDIKNLKDKSKWKKDLRTMTFDELKAEWLGIGKISKSGTSDAELQAKKDKFA